VISFEKCVNIIPFNLLLVVLGILQIYWFTLILRIAIRHIKHGDELNDSREEKEKIKN
jgi:uncharacterized membrane protein